MSARFIAQSPELAPAAQRQRQAADTAVSVWVAASAGAGKTRVLTDRLLRLMLEGANPAGLLALTYTRAAAKEMAARLIEQARALAIASPETRMARVFDLLETDEDLEAATERARSLYEQILETPGGLQIQTIHAFCQSLLGRFPFEAGLTPGFQAIEDAARNDLLIRASAQVLNTRDYGALKSLVQGDKLVDLIGALVKIDWAKLDAATRLRALDAQLGGGLAGQSVEGVLTNFATELEAQKPNLDALIALARTSKKATEPKFAHSLEAALRSPDAWAAMAPLLLTDKGARRANLMKSALIGEAPALCTLFELVEWTRERVRALRLYALNQDLLQFGQAVTAAFQAEKARRGVLDFDDLITYAQRLLAQDQGPTYVQYRLDQRIEHILVDEAQDTSTAQWQVISALAEPFFADDSGMDDRARTLFVVGDFKQSIYSFQGANPKLFQEKRQRFLAMAPTAMTSVDMVHSFRSAPVILDFVDHVAVRLSQGGLTGVDSQLLAHRAVQQARQGRVEVWPVPEAVEEKPKVDWQPLRQPQTGENPRAALGRLIARHIHRLCFDPAYAARPEAYLSEGRRLQPGDFLILLQNRRPEFANALIAELKALQVPVTGVDRLALTKELLVLDLLALGQVCVQPDDDLALAALLKSPLYGWSEAALFNLAHGRGAQSLMARLATVEPNLAAQLQALAAKIGQVSVYEFYATYLFVDGMRGHILSAVGPEAEEVMTLFLDRARAFDLEANGDLLGFLEAESASEQELKRDTSESRGEVRLMTVHGAKGLEAPVVILPDLRDPAKTGGARTDDQMVDVENVGPIWVPKGDFDVTQTKAAKDQSKAEAEAERERLFYVALTRAEERLIICAERPRETRGDKVPWYNTALDVAQAYGEAVDFDLAVLGWVAGPGFALGTLPPVPDQDVEISTLDDPIALPNWAHTRIDDAPERAGSLAPSSLGEVAVGAAAVGEAILAPTPRQQALQRGTLIHAALEHVAGKTRDKWHAQVTAFFTARAPDVSVAEREIWAQEVQAALENKDLQAFFDADSMAEVSLVGTVYGKAMAGQIDRLVVREDLGQVWILDYKTNRPPPRDARDIPPAYRAQMAAYTALLQPLYPAYEIRSFLFWTHTCTLMPVMEV